METVSAVIAETSLSNRSQNLKDYVEKKRLIDKHEKKLDSKKDSRKHPA